MHICLRIPAFSVKIFADSAFNMLLFKCRKAEQDIKNMKIIGTFRIVPVGRDL